MALEICERSLVLNEGIIKEDSLTKDILQNKQLMKENRLDTLWICPSSLR